MARSKPNVPLMTLFFVLFVTSVGFGLVIPILPLIAREFGASAGMLGLMTASYSAVQFLFAPVWGQVSDRTGRKKVLLLGITGLALSFFFMGLARSFWMLFAARVLGGFLSSAAIPTAQAMAAELSDDDNRAKAMGLMGAALGAGFIFGPLISGVLIPLGFSVPFFTGGAMGLATVALSVRVLQEPPRRSAPDAGAAGARVAARASALSRLRLALSGPGKPYYLLAFFIMFSQGSHMTSLAYLLTDRFGASPSQVSMAFAVTGVVAALFQGAAIGPITARLGEFPTLLAGLALGAAAYVGLAASPALVLAVACVALTSVSMAVPRPPATSLLSKVTELPQGITMGVQSSFDSLGRVIGPLWAGYAYDLFPNLPFLTSALTLAGAWLYMRAQGAALKSAETAQP